LIKSILHSIIILLAIPVTISAQSAPDQPVQQRDLLDVFGGLIKGKAGKHVENRTDTTITDNFSFSVLPAVGYTLQTGLAGLVSANATWHSAQFPKQKVSAVTSALTYTQYNQIMWISQWSVWGKSNKYNYTGELRLMKYPQYTYGIGSSTLDEGRYMLDYAYLRLYGDMLRQLGFGIYGGIGYRLDYHWGIEQFPPTGAPPTDFDKYGYRANTISSGLAFNLLMDTRDNPINAQKGTYAKLVCRVNPNWLGSESDWSSLTLDFRKYISLKPGKQTLAIWSYNWLTLSGNPPYLDLPSLGWDINNNTGRGYIQSRFMGKQMLYAEAEYRFDITRNGLFGAVVFANAHGFTDWPSGRFTKLNPGGGGGLRLRLNKKSGTNIAIDYGFGLDGSRGLFVNLGEVF
jgi:outer membrane protein assembly factor BamA